jgi:membrane protease YdiL (CAAX protease family)
MSRATAAKAGAAPAKSSAAPKSNGYFARSELPLTSLLFLLPFLLLYEAYDREVAGDIRAFSWMQDFFEFFGATGRHLPALGVVGILLAWHIARGDRWHVAPRHLIGMLVESMLLAVPLILVGFVAARYLPMAAVTITVPGWLQLSVGAGIYEELVFRLIAFTLLSLLFIDLLGMKRFWAYLLMVLTSSLAFSLYHYWGNEPFVMRTFAFRTFAGVFFGAVFAFRGFGVSAGTHASYDILINLLQSLSR